MFENIKEAIRDLKGETGKIDLIEIKPLIEKYFLQELRKGEHPDDIEFDFLDMTGEIMDTFSTNEEMYRVDFKNSTYFKKEVKDGKRKHEI